MFFLIGILFTRINTVGIMEESKERVSVLRLWGAGRDTLTTHCSILQVLILLQDLDEVPNGRFGTCLKQPEGQVVVAAGQGPISGIHLGCRQELTTRGEPLVVVVEALQSLSAGELCCRCQ